MFFAEGTFVSQRPDVVPGLATVASEARIWYGHGQRRVPERSDLTSRWAEPSLADDLTSSNVPALGAFDETGSRLGFDPGPGVENPNEFANDWMLLRHVTLLTPPSDQRAQRLPSLGAAGLYGVTFDLNNLNERARLADSVFQVNLQPAVSGVFWNAQELDPAAVNPTLPGYVDGFTGQTRRVTTLAYPTEELAAARTASGLVDIATTTLTDIETVATRGQFDVRTVRGRADFLAKLAQQRGGTMDGERAADAAGGARSAGGELREVHDAADPGGDRVAERGHGQPGVEPERDGGDRPGVRAVRPAGADAVALRAAVHGVHRGVVVRDDRHVAADERSGVRAVAVVRA
jgi:hypothetical protein